MESESALKPGARFAAADAATFVAMAKVQTFKTENNERLQVVARVRAFGDRDTVFLSSRARRSSYCRVMRDFRTTCNQP